MITLDLNERLRYEGEGDALDFKSAQYAFAGATDDQKSELLKDLVAFANSWRRTDAYILLGFREVKGSRAEVVGIHTHIDDAHLQQFVNSKLHRPLRFAYSALNIEGKDVAVIHIPVQERPFYSTSKFGKVEANAVYVRRGSSTAVAKPDEIARMGRAEIVGAAVALDVFFADPESRTRVVPVLESHVLEIPPRRNIPDFRSSRSAPYGGLSGTFELRNYYRELATFTRTNRLLSPVWIAVENMGTSAALDVRLEIAISGANGGLYLLDSGEYPEVPQKEYDTTRMLANAAVPRQHPDLEVVRVGDDWLVVGRAEKVQAKSTVWFKDSVYIGSEVTQVVEWRVKAFADNLPSPHQQALSMEIRSRVETADLDRILELEDERFTRSAEHRAFLRRLGIRDTE